MWPFVILLILGFFFPPAWLGLVAYTIYFMVTKDKRRDGAIKGYIEEMLEHDLDSMNVPTLYYEAAFSFAKANGAQFEEWERPDIVFVFQGVDVASQHVRPSFSRLLGGGTQIILT